MHSTPSKQCSPQCWSPSVFPAGLLDLQGGGTCGMLFSQTCVFSAVFASISSYESSSSLAGYICSRVICFASSWRMHTVYLFRYVYVYMYIYIYDAGLPHPPSPPSPWYPPVPVKWVVVLFVLVAFPVWSCLASSPPPPVEWGLWSFCLAPPRLWGAVCSTEVWYGCCHLLLVMSSLRALSPPPLWGGACGRFGWPRPACVGQCVLQRYGMVAAAC